MSDATHERWLPIPGWEGWYEVSDHGRVRSLDRLIPHGGGAGQRRLRGKVLQPIANDDGYLYVRLWSEHEGQRRFLHVLVLTVFVGPCPPGMQGCHGPAGNGDNHLTNLRWDTRNENMLDQVRHGTHHEAGRTQCPIDHLLVAPNLRADAVRDGRRGCLACSRARAAESKARKRGLPFDFRAVADDRYRKIMALAG